MTPLDVRMMVNADASFEARGSADSCVTPKRHLATERCESADAGVVCDVAIPTDSGVFLDDRSVEDLHSAEHDHAVLHQRTLLDMDVRTRVSRDCDKSTSIRVCPVARAIDLDHIGQANSGWQVGLSMQGSGS